MWLIFALISLLSFTTVDIVGKKLINDQGPDFIPKILVSSFMFLAVIGIIMYLLGLGESGQAPWTIIINNPFILLNVICHTLTLLFFFLSISHIGLSMNEAVGSTFGAFYFAGLILVNLITGELSSVKDMLHPLRIIPIIIAIIFTLLLPNIEVIRQNKRGGTLTSAKDERRSIVIGLTLLLISTLFDSADSLFSTIVFDSGSVGTVDYLITGFCGQIIPFAIFYIVTIMKTKKLYIPFAGLDKKAVLYPISLMMSTVLYIVASSYDAVRTGILFIAFPILPIIGAKIILKERYTRFQNVCIWTITISAIAFCVFDALL